MKKFLADESVDFRVIQSLREDEYEIEAIIEIDSSRAVFLTFPFDFYFNRISRNYKEDVGFDLAAIKK